ncbi:hypothetical protein FRC05_011540 [Tulasnella sp. 425]|nr:hypothetical protein FRC05_011540 [Tulasnella sp. 425]
MSSGSTSRPGSNYPGTRTYLQLVWKEISNVKSVDFIQLYSLISHLNAYITTNSPNNLRLGALRAPFIAVMEQANRMKGVIEAAQPLKDADVAFRIEMLILLGQVKIREAKAKNRNRWLAAAGGALLTVGAVVVAPALTVGALKQIGLHSVGPVVTYIAAGIRSGAVRSGSIFGLRRSAAMGGDAVDSAAEMIAAGVAALGASAGLLGLGGLGGSDNNEGDDAWSHI